MEHVIENKVAAHTKYIYETYSLPCYMLRQPTAIFSAQHLNLYNLKPDEASFNIIE